MPLVQGRVTRRTYADLMTKVEKRLAGWKTNKLSLAGRITLAKSVLCTLPAFAMQTSKLPSLLCDEIDRKIRGFIWGSSTNARKAHLVSWQQICKPKDHGGLGFRNSRQQNLAFLMKLAWGVMTNSSELWVQVLRHKYGKGLWDINTVKTCGNLSHQWRGLLAVWEATKRGLQWKIGDGCSVSFWHDAWLERDLVLSEILPESMIGDTDGYTVKQFCTDNGTWCWDSLAPLPMEIKQKLRDSTIVIRDQHPDHMFWSYSSNGKFTLASAYASLCPVGDGDQFRWKRIWAWQGPQRVRAFLWLCAHDALLTNVKRARIGLTDMACCPRCVNQNESTLHVLRDCFFVKSIWQSIVLVRFWQVFFSLDIRDWLMFGLANHSADGFCPSWDTAFGLLPWLAWKWRNSLVFDEGNAGHEPPLATLQRYIQDITAAKVTRDAVSLVQAC